jgi:hypothetical protein
MTSVEAQLFAWHRNFQELGRARSALREAVVAGAASETVSSCRREYRSFSM